MNVFISKKIKSNPIRFFCFLALSFWDSGEIHAALSQVDIEKEIFADIAPIEVRWKKYHEYILKKPKSAQRMGEKALQSKDWYMRDAGLKTLIAVNAEKAKKTARILLQKDPSLLVRASAVTALKILKDTQSENVLWNSLSDPRNFRKDQSLWIRPRIMATLVEFKMGKKEKFQEFYNDVDPQVARLARLVIE